MDDRPGDHRDHRVDHHEPTIPDADYSYCSSDRRHAWNVLAVFRAPTVSGGLGALDQRLADRVDRPRAVGQPLYACGADHVALTGMGAQRAVQTPRPVWGQDGSQLPEPGRVRRAGDGVSSDKPFTILTRGWLNERHLGVAHLQDRQHLAPVPVEIFNVILTT